MKTRRPFSRRFSAILLVLLLGAVAAPAVPIREIRIRNLGAGALDEASIRSLLSLKTGQEFDASGLNRDIREMERSGRFSLIEAQAQPADDGIIVVISVLTRPRLRQIEVVGADWLGNRKAAELMELEIGSRVDDATLAAAARKLKSTYIRKFYPYARVEWTVKTDEKAGSCDVKVTVNEGQRGRVKSITVAGATSVREEDIREALRHKVYRWYNPWHWVTGAGRLKEEDLDADIYALRRFYTDRGYLDVKVGEPTIKAREGRRLDVTIPVEEGPLYKVSAVRITGTTLFSNDVIRGLVRIKGGDIASQKAVEDVRESLMAYYGNRGYISTRVDPRLESDAARGLVAIEFAVREGKLATIRDVRILGNVQTKDKVIRREIEVYPGDKYNRSRVQASERRVKNLQYFSYVQSYPEETADPSEYDLVFEVEEETFGQAGAGVSFSSIDAAAVYFEVAHGNFDLRNWPPVGGGQKVRLRTILGTERKDVEFSFIEPWFMDRKLALGFDLFHHEALYYSSDYDQKNTGGRVSLTKALTPRNRISIAYGLEQIDIFDVDEDASQTIKDEEGASLKSSVTLALTHDTRDRTYIPTRGNFSRLSTTFAGGPLMGDTDTYSLDLQSNQYFPLWLGHVFLLRGKAGTIDTYGDSDRVRIFDRYFLGGANTIRGFDFREVGPVDENEEPIGGQSSLFGSAEYTIPVYKLLRFATFYDVGMVWPDAYEFEGDYNSSWGIGLRIDIRMLPLRFDYSWPIDVDPHNDRDSGKFSFFIGYPF